MAMFIHTSRAGDTVFCTLDVEPKVGSAISTTMRMTIEDARQLASQMEKHILDHTIEHDPHEQAALMDEYHMQQLEDQDLLFADEPF